MIKVKSNMKTLVKDKGAAHILREIEKMGSGLEVTTGIHLPEGDQFAFWKGELQSDVNIAQYAAWNEEGTRDIPSRPAFARAMTLNLDKYEAKTMRGMKSIYNGTGTVMKLLNANAKLQKSWTKESIRNLNDPLNSIDWAREKNRRGMGDTPLVASGTMLKSVTSKVQKTPKRKQKNHLIALFNKVEKKLISEKV